MFTLLMPIDRGNDEMAGMEGMEADRELLKRSRGDGRSMPKVEH